MGHLNLRRQHGVALPVMLIMLVVMLVSSIYLLKSSNSSTIGAANLAYDDSLAKAADLGLQAGFQYLQVRSKANKALMLVDDHKSDGTGNGYNASYDGVTPPTASSFWDNATTINPTADQPFKIQYVIHRACLLAIAYDDKTNACVQTSENPLSTGSPVALGASVAITSASYTSAPQIHYMITARIYGPRGGYVVNQMIALIDA